MSYLNKKAVILASAVSLLSCAAEPITYSPAAISVNYCSGQGITFSCQWIKPQGNLNNENK